MRSPPVAARRRRLVIGGAAAAASLLLHLAAWSLLRAAPPAAPRGSAAAAKPVRWLQVSLLPAAAEPAPAAPVHAAPAHTAPRRAAAVPRAKRVARRAPHAPTPAPAVVVPVAAPADGAVFGLPRIGYGATSSGAVQAVAPAAVAWAAASTGAHDALRRQIAEHAQRQLAALPPAPADGHCTLADAGEPQLQCDSDHLTAALGDHAPSLARLVAAHQRSMPGAPAVLEAQAGRYRLLP